MNSIWLICMFYNVSMDIEDTYKYYFPFSYLSPFLFPHSLLLLVFTDIKSLELLGKGNENG